MFDLAERPEGESRTIDVPPCLQTICRAHRFRVDTSGESLSNQWWFPAHPSEGCTLGESSIDIKELLKSPQTINICKNQYIKHSKSKLTKYKVNELRELAQARGISIKKISSISGNSIYKSKGELLNEIFP